MVGLVNGKCLLGLSSHCGEKLLKVKDISEKLLKVKGISTIKFVSLAHLVTGSVNSFVTVI